MYLWLIRLVFHMWEVRVVVHLGSPTTPQLLLPHATTTSTYMTLGIKAYQSMVEEFYLFASCGMTSLCSQAATVQGVHKDVPRILRLLHDLRRKQGLAAK